MIKIKYSQIFGFTFIMFLILNIIIVPIRGLLTAQGILIARYLDEMMFLIFLFFLFMNFMITKRIHVHKIILWIIVLSIWGIFSAIINEVPTKIAVFGIVLILKPLVLFLTFSGVFLPRATVEIILVKIEKFFKWLVVLSLSYTLIFEMLMKKNYIPGIVPGNHRLGIQVFRSFYTHPGTFGDMMLFCGLFFGSQYISRRSKNNLLFFALSILGLIFSARMKTLIFFPVGIFLLFILKNTKGLRIKRKAITKLILIFTVSLILLITVFFVLKDPLLNYFDTNSQTVRTQLLITAIRINFESFGLGKGPGMFGSSISINQHYSPLYYDYGIDHLRGGSPDFSSFITDQWWAWYLGEIGFIGFVIFIISIFSIMKGLFNILYFSSLQKDNRLKSLIYLAILGITYAIISGFADPNLTRSPTGYLIMMISGIVFSVSSTNKNVTHNKDLGISTPKGGLEVM